MNDCDQGCLKNPKNVGTYVCAYFLNQYDFCKTGLTNTLQYSLRQRLILISSQANGISKWLFQWYDTTLGHPTPQSGKSHFKLPAFW